MLQIAQSTRHLPAGGPVGRAQAARWLTFARAQLPAALGHANALAREFALGLNAAPGPSAAAGWALMHEVGPRPVLKLSDWYHKPARIEALASACVGPCGGAAVLYRDPVTLRLWKLHAAGEQLQIFVTPCQHPACQEVPHTARSTSVLPATGGRVLVRKTTISRPPGLIFAVSAGAAVQ